MLTPRRASTPGIRSTGAPGMRQTSRYRARAATYRRYWIGPVLAAICSSRATRCAIGGGGGERVAVLRAPDRGAVARRPGLVRGAPAGHRGGTGGKVVLR